MAGLLGMVFIAVVGVNQALYQYKTAEMLAGVGGTDQEFSHVSQISLQEHLSDGYDRGIQAASPRAVLLLS